MCRSVYLTNGECKSRCKCDKTRHSDSQDYENKRFNESSLKELMLTPMPSENTLEAHRVAISIEEIHYGNCKPELAIGLEYTHTCTSLKYNEPENDSVESKNATLFFDLYNCVGTLVKETGEEHNTATDCSEVEMVPNPDENDSTVVRYYTGLRTARNENEIYSEEESDTNKDCNSTSQTRATAHDGFTLDEEPLSKDFIPFASNDDGTSRNESTFGVLSSTRRDFNYSNNSFRAKIVQNSELAVPHNQSHSIQDNLPHPIVSSCDNPVKKLVTGNEAVDAHHLFKNPTVVDDHRNVSHTVTGYVKPAYPVLVGNSVKVFPTNLFAKLPQHDKFLVKERLHDPAVGCTKAVLVMKSNSAEAQHNKNDVMLSDAMLNQSLLPHNNNNDDVEDDVIDDGMSAYFRQNCSSPGRILYTCDGRFNGRTKYPIPNRKAVNTTIGKGGNGFVFTMYHDRKQYAVKKTVYRANEVNVHSALKHKNVLPLLAVLMGEKHERHRGKFYCYHFMPRMDYDLRQILSSKDVGCMKYYYRNCSKEPAKWETGFNNIKFVLAETLEALAYIHSTGYVHRDVKASNIMIKMRCHCRPLECTCRSKFQVKLGDFDSSGTIPGLGITEPTDQMIKFASILPLGTPGYRAPEVSMHIVLSGPYETLYTTAVDIWSFGCLCLNICIGKTAALKQREEASLLLSLSHACSTELWERTTKINELKKTKPFSNQPELIRLVGSCLQVNSGNRPSAKDALNILRLLVK